MSKEETIAVMELLAEKGKNVKTEEIAQILGYDEAVEFTRSLFLGRGAVLSNEETKNAAKELLKTLKGE